MRYRLAPQYRTPKTGSPGAVSKPKKKKPRVPLPSKPPKPTLPVMPKTVEQSVQPIQPALAPIVQQNVVKQIPVAAGNPGPVLNHPVLNNDDVIKLHANATDADRLFFDKYAGHKFQVDLKRDGERNFLFKKGSNIALVNKHKTVYLPPGTPWTYKDFPGARIRIMSPTLSDSIVKALGDHNGIIDCEYRAVSDHLYDWAKQVAKPASTETMVSMFDVLELDDKDLRQEPLFVRRQILENSVAANARAEVDETKIADTEAEARKIAAEYVAKGFEGGVAKPLDHKYDSTEFMLKLKSSNDIDLVIMGFKKSKEWLNRQLPKTFLVGLFDKATQEWHIVGSNANGFSDKERREVLPKLLAAQIPDDEARAAYGDQYDPNIIYTSPEVVIRAKFLRLTPDGKLREPTIINYRNDKPAEDCVIDQIFPDKSKM